MFETLDKFLSDNDESATTQVQMALDGIDEESLDRYKKNVDSGESSASETTHRRRAASPRPDSTRLDSMRLDGRRLRAFLPPRARARARARLPCC